MKRKSSKKLSFGKVTIANLKPLTPGDLRGVKAGADSDFDDVCTCCWDTYYITMCATDGTMGCNNN